MATAMPRPATPMTPPKVVSDWVDHVAKITQPDRIHWCDGSEHEYQGLIKRMLASGDLVEFNQQTHPGCFLHRSNPTDVARWPALGKSAEPSGEREPPMTRDLKS